jgi:Domain of unknown function (DUF397)
VSKHSSAPESLEWRVSRTCDAGACVGVARSGDSILIGNTNVPGGAVSEFSIEEWQRFLAGVKLGDFDGLA